MERMSGGFLWSRPCLEVWRAPQSMTWASAVSCGHHWFLSDLSSRTSRFRLFVQSKAATLTGGDSRGGTVQYVLALDQGTTSSRALLFDQEDAACAVAHQEFDQIFPEPGWVEHSPSQIASSQIEVASQALSKAGARPSDVAAIGIANQR